MMKTPEHRRLAPARCCDGAAVTTQRITFVGLAMLLAALLVLPATARADVGGHGFHAFGPEAHVAYSFKDKKLGVGGRLQAYYYNSGRSPGSLDLRYTHFFGGLKEANLGISGLRADGRDYIVPMGGVSVGGSLRMRPDETMDLGIEAGLTGALFPAAPVPGIQAFLMGRFGLRHKFDLTAGVGLQYLIHASVPLP